MKSTAALLIAGSIAAISAPAMAQSNDSVFTGPRVEVLVGYDSNDIDANASGSTVTENVSPEGFNYGIGIGYDYSFNGFVVGVEGEWSDTTADSNLDQVEFEVGRDWYVGARAGILARPDLLVYAKAGYTNLRYRDTNFSDGVVESVKADADGYRLGAGAEYAVNTNIFTKLEYRYSNYSREELRFPNDDPFSINGDRHQVTFGVGYRF